MELGSCAERLCVVCVGKRQQEAIIHRVHGVVGIGKGAVISLTNHLINLSPFHGGGTSSSQQCHQASRGPAVATAEASAVTSCMTSTHHIR